MTDYIYFKLIFFYFKYIHIIFIWMSILYIPLHMFNSSLLLKMIQTTTVENVTVLAPVTVAIMEIHKNVLSKKVVIIVALAIFVRWWKIPKAVRKLADCLNRQSAFSNYYYLSLLYIIYFPNPIFGRTYSLNHTLVF